MIWKVYNKDGIERCEIHKLEYSGTFMGEKFITASIRSPHPIEFAIGDYVIYRGERFTLNYDPSIIKNAGLNKAGDAFIYENIKFNSYSDELIRCQFLDYVLEDNLIHFSSLPSFGFHALTIHDLANRIQANLDRVYDGLWTVNVDDSDIDVSDVFITADRLTVWDALALVSTVFKSNFIIRGRTITIGTAGNVIDEVFEYGKGKGLNKITRIADSEQQIITRLRVYGSTRNLPLRYYNKLTNPSSEPYLPDNMAVQNLMLPSFPYETLDPYLDSPNIEVLGVMEGSVFFDGSDESLPEIYPSLEGMTAAQLEAAGIHVYLDPGDNGNLDEVVSDATNIDGTPITDNGVFEDEEVPQFKLVIKDIGFDLSDYLLETPVIAMKTGMNAGREFEIQSCVKEGNKYVLTCNRVSDVDRYFPYGTMNIKAGDKFVLLNIEMPEVYIQAASQRLLEAGQEYLSKNDYVRYTYSVDISPVYMARNPNLHDTIVEGDYLQFADDDLGIGGSIIIDSLIIKEGDEITPTYEVTLSEEKQVGTLQKIQNQIDYLISGGGNIKQTESLINLIGDRKFLSKINPDTAKKVITFLEGVKFGNYTPGLLGSGGRIDGNGNGELRSLRLWETLEVPELRYNRAEVFTGVQWQTFGAGIIESVEIDTDEYGHELQSGIITLKLEDGEFGAIDVDDFCQGIYHNFDGQNDTESEDQRNGNFHFQGFRTSYFRITEILDEGTNGRFRYVLRGTSERWNQLNHPKPFMHFACYANPSNPDRQACSYSTTEYSIRLRNMTTWEYGEDNIYAIEGKLDGFKLGETIFQGNGQVIGNGYFYGNIQNIVNAPYELLIEHDGDNFLAFGESLDITCKVRKGLNDVTDEVEEWSVTRESGNQTEDDAWNIAHQDFAGQITLHHDPTYSDLGEGLSTLFRFVASAGSETAILNLTI